MFHVFKGDGFAFDKDKSHAHFIDESGDYVKERIELSFGCIDFQVIHAQTLVIV